MSLAENDIAALWVTLRLAAVTTVALLVIGAPLAWWLARSRARGKFLVEAAVSLPLVLPPTVLGFYLLLLLGAGGPLGPEYALAFTFGGLVIGSCVYSLPFAVQPMRDAFAAIPPRTLEAAATLGAAPRDVFFSVILPQAAGGMMTAMVLTFAHTLGEFGVVLMIGGNIPGSTQVLSIAIYDHVEALEYGQAHVLSALLLALSFIMLAAIYALRHKRRGSGGGMDGGGDGGGGRLA